MGKTLFLTGALALVASALPAQTVRWNDRPTAAWQDQAPRVKLYIEGSRAVSYGAPVALRFQVSDNAYVTVVRVDDDGRMTILFPYSRNQRAAARAGVLHYVRNPRLGGTMSFVSTDRMSGYVFAVASYAPLDFSQFENRDYNNMGGWSRFTMANRSIARRPDVFIDRFAAAVLWDPSTPYDYDVDYYHAIGYQGGFNTFAMCAAGGFSNYVGWRTYLAQFSTWDRLAYPWAFNSMCGDMYYQLRCYSSVALYGYSSCSGSHIAYQPPTTPTGGQPGDSTVPVPNEGVVRGGLFAPTPVPIIPAGPEPPPVERLAGRFDQIGGAEDLSGITSIPPRATRKMKEEDARRASGGTSPSRTAFDGAASDKQKTGTAVADAPERIQPPSREPTKSKATGEPRRETGSKAGFGSNTGRTSEPRSSGVDRVSNTPKSSAGTGSAANPPSIKSAPATEKKKPPQN
ncbi:MAG TPA: DUF4384 domain-containing protein [Gemmatimonadaceae bacterium]|nr:DUF4384 domain-containing protein [Gemmatimonadaceae bacterium]